MPAKRQTARDVENFIGHADVSGRVILYVDYGISARRPAKRLAGPPPENFIGLHDWAAEIAALEPAIRAAALDSVLGIAADRAVPAADRRFARAQAQALRRAFRRKR